MIRKLLIVMLAFSMAFLLVTPVFQPKAEANPIVAGAAAVEIGTLAFWGGTVLVASLGVAVGLDKDLMDNVKDFGKSTWEGANDAIKASITWTTSKMTLGSSARYEVKFTPEVKTYLESSFDTYFRTSPNRPKISINPTTMAATTAASLATFAVAKANLGTWIGTFKDPTNPYTSAIYMTKVQHIKDYKWAIYTTLFETLTSNPYYTGTELTINTKDAATAIDILIQQGLVKGAEGYRERSTFTDTMTPDVIVPGAIPVGMPDVFTMPAPAGVIDAANPDVIDYAFPAIGYPQGVIPANPWDVAIGNPAIPGQTVGDLTIGQVISTPADVTVPANPPITGDDTGINFGPLKSLPITTAFPFSLPWDVKRLFDLLVATPEPPSIHSTFMGQTVDVEMPVFVTENIMIIRSGILILFGLGLVLGTRKLLGGAQ